MIQKIVIYIIKLFDFFHHRKIFSFLNKKNLINFNIFFDVGAHKGESIKLFLKHLNIKEIVSFEASPITFEYLKKKWCSELYGSKNNVNHMAKVALNQTLFQKTDPNYRYSFDEIVDNLKSMEYETLKERENKDKETMKERDSKAKEAKTNKESENKTARKARESKEKEARKASENKEQETRKRKARDSKKARKARESKEKRKNRR